MGLYQKFAKDTAVWINLPDPAKKIRDQGLRDLQNMENVQASIRRENDAILTAMANNAQMESENRKANWDIRQNYRDVEAEARRRQHKVVMNNYEVEEANRQRRSKDWEALLQFTKTGADFLNKADAKFKDDALQIWRQWHDEYGITSKDLAAVRSIDQHQWNKSRSDNEVWQGLRARGIPENMIEKMRGINSYGQLAVATIDAQNLAQSWGTVYASNADNKYNIAGREVDFNTAFTSGDPTLLREVMRRIDMDEMRKHGDGFPSTKIWAYSGAGRIKREIQNQFLNKQQNKAIKDAQSNKHEDEHKLIRNEIGKFDGQNDKFANGKGIYNARLFRAGVNPTRESMRTAKVEINEALVDMLDKGLIDIEEVEEYLELKVPHKGQGGKLVAIEEMEPQTAELLRAAIKKKQDENWGRLQSQLKDAQMDDVQMELNYRKIMDESPNISMETMSGLHAAAVKKGNTRAAQYMSNRIASHNITINDSVNAGYVRERIQNNEHITRDELDALKLSPAMTATLWAEVQANNVFLPTEGNKEILEDAIKKMLIKRIPQSKTYGEQETRLLAEDGAYNRALVYYKNATMRNNGDHKAALQETLGLIRQDIWNPEDDWEPTLPTKALGGVREFSGYVYSAPETREVVNLPKLKEQVSSNPGSIYEVAYVDREALEAKINRVNRGLSAETIPQAALIANYSGNKYSPLEVEMAQIEYYNKEAKAKGLPLLQPYSKDYVKSVQKAEEIVHPLALQYLSTPGYVNQAVVKQGRNPIYQNYTIGNADKLLFGNNDYNSVSTADGIRSSTEVHDFHITNATCYQANAISIRHESDFGRHQIKSGMILEGCKLAGISPTAKFNKENQDKIFQALFKKHGLSMYDNENLSDKDRFYLQEVHKMLNSENIGDLGYNSPALLSPLAFQIKWETGYYASV